MLPNVEWTINAYTVGSLLFAIAGFYWVTKSDMKVMKDNVVAIKADLQQLTQLMRDVAVQKTEIENLRTQLASQASLVATLEGRVFQLSRGRGFMQVEVDGEYSNQGKVGLTSPHR